MCKAKGILTGPVRKFNGPVFIRRAFLLLCLLTLAAGGAGDLRAQGTKKGNAPAQPTRSAQAIAREQLAKTREEFIKATKEYKASLQKLLVLYEGNARQAQERLVQGKELQAAGLISLRDVELSAQAVTAAQAKLEQVRQQIANADTQMADTLVEAQAEEQLAKAPPIPVGRVFSTTAYIRYNAPGVWSLSDAWKVQQFFLAKFRRQLPISAFGQSSVHDRWSLDHRNAMDVPLNPDGPEGQALMEFLRSNGIPFSAFRMAIQGAATGPHIHVGRPSHRL